MIQLTGPKAPVPWFILLWSCVISLLAAEPHQQVGANQVAEIAFTSKATVADPFNEISLDVLFTDPEGKLLRVPAFWDGGNTWKVRYASPLTGIHRYRTECNRKGEFGLDGLTGEIEVVPYKGENPLFKHGPLRVAADHRHFEHADGTPFFWLGDTWWMGLCQRIHWPDEFKTLAADRKAKGFNVVQIVAGLYPDMPPFDPRGANEAGFPWETNYARIRPEYFDAADQRLNHMVEQGLVPCLVGAWGYFLPWMGVEKAKQHWRYLIARYGAKPIIWCAAGEANLPYYLEKGFPFEARDQVKGWSEIMRYIRDTDPFHRLLSTHPTGLGRLSARGTVTDESLLDFDMLQTGHGMRDTLRPTIDTLRRSYTDDPIMPVLDSEVCFEQLGGNIPAEIPRLMFWACMLNGAAGHTYGANGIWQCNRPGEPHGKSPHGGSYGNIPWNEAMNLAGSRQVGLGKQFLESFEWPKLQPQNDSVRWLERSGPDDWGHWIWFPEGDPKSDAPVEPRYFRRTFQVPDGGAIERARLFITADDKFEAWINGTNVGSGGDWRVMKNFEVGSLLNFGANVLAVRAENGPGPVKANAAGLIAVLEIQLHGGAKGTVVSGSEWRVSKSDERGWNESGYNDKSWSEAKILGKYGDGPWGKIGGYDQAVVPFAAGIGDRLRVIYAPDPNGVHVSQLRPRAEYNVTRFDPVTGKRAAGGLIKADAGGEFELQPPATAADWVVALKAED